MALIPTQLKAQSGNSISVMALGDSLTWGYDGAYTEPTPQQLAAYDDGGYRDSLYQTLTAAGANVTMVGVSNENPSLLLTAAGETAQDGFNGYRIDQISANLSGYQYEFSNINDYGGYWLSGGGGTNRSAQTANFILLQIGANDLQQMYDPLYTGTGTVTPDQLAADTTTRLEALIKQIMVLEPNATILTDGTPVMINTPYETTASADYGTDVENMVASQFQNEKVFYVDMPKALQPGGFDDFEGDGVHYTALGYQLMGEGWADAILEADPVPEPSTYALFAGGAVMLFAWRKFRKA